MEDLEATEEYDIVRVDKEPLFDEVERASMAMTKALVDLMVKVRMDTGENIETPELQFDVVANGLRMFLASVAQSTGDLPISLARQASERAFEANSYKTRTLN